MLKQDHMYLGFGLKVSGLTHLISMAGWALFALEVTVPMLVFACIGTVTLGVSFPYLHMAAKKIYIEENCQLRLIFPVRDYFSYLFGAGFLFSCALIRPEFWLMLPAYLLVCYLGCRMCLHLRYVPKNPD